ncbi:PadR family transcriptional regulator [Demetria terragena]|uniref:PadR family transcriptional regulator n=1 Tax=Demetria terragena TaxID=63959 RepID=UPI0003A9D0C0|nr:PadR family transcriptional regulator [Demetria terragena]
MVASRRAAMLELAILGLLQDSPMHGYELRKRLTGVLGAFRVVSYGSLYPCLRTLEHRAWISTSGDSATGRRTKITYELTAEGKEHFQAVLDRAGPTAWEDDSFDVHFAFFGRASRDARLRILEGRRSRLEQRLDAARTEAKERRERADAYTAELHRHGLEREEREIRWLSELIETERTAYSNADRTIDTSAPPDTD